MKLTALKYGETELSESMIFRDGDREKSRPISLTVYLIETEGRRILVDAGCDTMPGFVLKHFCGPVDVLERYELAADDITDVILTHGHHDHMEAVGHFRRATVWIQRAEYERYAERFLPRDASVRIFDEEERVCEGVLVKRIGGHTRGSSVVHVCCGTREFVMVGDECYAKECLERGIPTGSSCDPTRSEDFIRTYRKGSAIPLLAHDDTILPGQNGFVCVFDSSGDDR